MKNYDNHSREELIAEINALNDTIKYQEKFSVLFESSPEAILFTSGDGRFLDCNPSASELFGYDKHELTGLSFVDIATDDIADNLPSIFREELAKNGIAHTGTYKKKNGDIFTADLLTKLISISGETYRWAIFHELSSSGEDPSVNVISDEKIKDLILLLPELIGDPEIVIETNESGHIKSANRIFFDNTGYTEKDLENGLELGRFIQTDKKEDPQTTYKKFLTGESLDTNEYSAVKKDNTTFPVIIYSTRIDSFGKSNCLRLFALDITDHKYIEKNLINMEKFHALGQISGGVLHNINNVLAIILGYIEISSKKSYIHKQCDVCLNVLEKIKAAALDGSDIVKRLNNITQIKTYHENEPVRINNIIEEALESYRPKLESTAAEKGIKFSINKNLQSIPETYGSAAEIRETLNNIILNSIDAMPLGGDLTAGTTVENETIIIEISDTGIGMSDDIKSNIFKPFYTTKEKGGIGLGLYVSKEMIQKAGGDIVVESEPEHGASFKIFLPVIRENAAPKKMIGDKTSGGSIKNIIVIDDEENICEIFSDFLTMDGHTVTTIRDGKDALDVFDPNIHDIVITDLNMPTISGLDIVAHIKKKSPKTTVVLITGSPASMERIKKNNSLVNYVLPKPINFKDLSYIIDLSPKIASGDK
jgi:PAS domain S-box-containing protein